MIPTREEKPAMQKGPRLVASTYAREACGLGVVHIGFGAFHRAHQAYYFDKMMEETGDLRWGIGAVNLCAEDSETFRMSTRDDGSYLLKAVAPSGKTDFRQVRAHQRFVDGAYDRDSALALLADTQTQVVTITITEAGYGQEAPEQEQPTHSAASSPIFPFLARALELRRERNPRSGLTLLSCDNIRANGQVLYEGLRRHLQARGKAALLGWMDTKVGFPCTMVDRITPRPRPEDSEQTASLFFPSDNPTIMTEASTQWVIEDRFAGERPPLESAGVIFTDSVTPYEEAKVRILNGGHTALAYLGALKGYVYFDEALGDRELREHFLTFEKQEVFRALESPIPFDRHAYLEGITVRLGNPYLRDEIARICADGYTKFPSFIGPTIAGCFSQGYVPMASLRAIASWFVFARRVRDGYSGLTYSEPHWSLLEPLLSSAKSFAQSRELWGALADECLFVTEVEEQIRRLM